MPNTRDASPSSGIPGSSPARSAPAAVPGTVTSRLNRVALKRLTRRWGHQLRRMLGIRRGLLVDGVYYKELTPESLRRALSKRGPGYKEFRVTFPDRTKQIIRCSRDRVFADLMGPTGIERLEPLLPVVRPGGRVLEFGAGTGYRAHWLSFVVGPSGGVVAITPDPGDVAFAQRRYPRPNISFERTESFGLAGETDGAFNAIVLLAPPDDDHERRILLNELWRLTAPGGALLVGLGNETDTKTPMAVASLARQSGAELRTFGGAGRPADAMVIKPVEEDSNSPEQR